MDGKTGGGRVRPTHRIDAATLSEGKFGESGTSLSSDLPISYHSQVATVWIPSVCARKNFKPVAGHMHGLIISVCVRSLDEVGTRDCGSADGWNQDTWSGADHAAPFSHQEVGWIETV